MAKKVTVELTEPQAMMIIMAIDDHTQYLAENGLVNSLAILLRGKEKIQRARSRAAGLS